MKSRKLKKLKSSGSIFFKKDLNVRGGFNFKRPADKVFSRIFKGFNIRY